MIAALPMYDWPETQSLNNDVWRKFADRLDSLGIRAPSALTRDQDLPGIWLSKDLLIAQTCSYPLETLLRGKVQYVATPSYHVEGCEQAGTYRSVIIKRGKQSDMPVPNENVAHLPVWSNDDVFAVNDNHSMSGYHALLRDAEHSFRTLPEQLLFTGSHRASIVAVGAGNADIAAIDCVTWQLARKFEAAAQNVYVAGWTKIRPGLPLVTSLNTDATLLSALRSASISIMNAVVLGSPTQK